MKNWLGYIKTHPNVPMTVNGVLNLLVCVLSLYEHDWLVAILSFHVTILCGFIFILLQSKVYAQAAALEHNEILLGSGWTTMLAAYHPEHGLSGMPSEDWVRSVTGSDGWEPRRVFISPETEPNPRGKPCSATPSNPHPS